ncbi:F0F1 ATP synthase subunit gamma [Candidatus Microgenomates bacterium]|nr:F0F1 ATP synthase subunit gamma [Candidatus Microgenomates bacterium]
MQNHKSQEIEFVSVGKKGTAMAGSLRKKVLADFSSNAPLNGVSAVFEFVLDAYMTGSYASVSIVYNRFISASKSETVEEILLPFSMKQSEQKTAQTEYMIEPDPALLVESLLKNFIEEKIRFAIMQNEAGEHSARMIAMKNATDNAGELIGSLTQLSNKLRQNKITSELLDMVTAKESVESS